MLKIKRLAPIILLGSIYMPPVEAADIVIGAPAALTGPYSFVGVSMEKGISIAVSEINASGGINNNKIVLKLEDYASDSAQAVTLLRRMAIRDRAVAIVGPSTSTDALATAPLANELKIPMLTNTPAPAARKGGKWVFTVPESPDDIMTSLARYGIEKLKIKRIAFVSVRDNVLFSSQRTVVRDKMASAGATIVSDDTISSHDSDFTALSTKIVGSDVEAISLYMPPEQAANLIIQARQAGLSKKVLILGPPGHVSQSYLSTGGSAVDGTYLIADYYPGTDTAINKAFVAAFKAKYGTLPDNWAAVGYTTIYILKQAILNAEPNVSRETVRDEVEKTKDLPTVLGQGRYTLVPPDRAPQYGGIVLVVKNGEFVPAEK